MRSSTGVSDYSVDRRWCWVSRRTGVPFRPRWPIDHGWIPTAIGARSPSMQKASMYVWRRTNPPNRGVHWASAQEVGLRILALAFAERAFFPEWSRREERLQQVAQMVGFHAARIPPTLDYARAQRNNHLLSEAAGLYTAGLLYPELRDSDRWRSLGRRQLEAGFARQVFDDGGYIQHSTTYQRLALSLGGWSGRLGAPRGGGVPP